LSDPRDELRQAVARAIAETAWDINPWPSLADAAIAAYERHRPRAAVVLTREEWGEASERAWVKLPLCRPAISTAEVGVCLRAAFPWLRVEGE